MQIIEVTISPAGEAKVETKGFAGASCRAASKFIEQALGQRNQEQLTGEFYVQPAQQQSLEEGA